MQMFMRNEKYILFLALVSLQLSSSCTDSDSVFTADLNQTDSSEKDEVDQQLKPFSKDRSVDKILEDFDRPLDSYPRITKEESFKDNQGIVYREGLDEPFTGRLIEYYENGKTSLSSTYLKGLLHGLQVKFFESGNRALEASFDQGVLSGVKTRWWENGAVREEEYWDGGEYKGRKLWDETGRLIREELLF